MAPVPAAANLDTAAESVGLAAERRIAHSHMLVSRRVDNGEVEARWEYRD